MRFSSQACTLVTVIQIPSVSNDEKVGEGKIRTQPGRFSAADDGLAGREGTFSICSFWLVEALTRAGRLEEARQNLEQMLTYANHLGLYSEEVGPVGEALGNFPQAFTHLALISACHTLD